MKKILFFLSLILFFSGCVTKTVYITKEKTVYVKPPMTYVVPKINLPMPPNKNKYINSNPFEREILLSGYSIDLLNTIKRYKLSDKALLKWYKDYNTSVSKIVSTKVVKTF